MSLPLPARTQIPYVVPKAAYDVTGATVTFDDPATSRHEQVVSVSFLTYTGVALINLTGDAAGPFVELPAGASFSFNIATEKVFIKGSGASCEVACVAARYEED